VLPLLQTDTCQGPCAAAEQLFQPDAVEEPYGVGPAACMETVQGRTQQRVVLKMGADPPLVPV